MIKEKSLFGKQTHKMESLLAGNALNGKALTSTHLTRLTNEINQGETGNDYWYDICKK